MLTWVIYDITEDRLRKKISDKCLDLGLQRIQYSVFLGDLNQNDRDVMKIFAQTKLEDKEEDRVYIFPMCREDFKRVELIGQEFDKKLVADELSTKTF